MHGTICVFFLPFHLPIVPRWAQSMDNSSQRMSCTFAWIRYIFHFHLRFFFVYIVCCWLISLNHFNFCIFNSKFVNANRYSFCSVLYFYYVFDFIVAILLLSLILWREHHSFPHKRRTNKHFITERRLNINNSFMANNNFVFKKKNENQMSCVLVT